MFHFFPRLDSGFLLASLQTNMNPLCIWSLRYVSCLLRLLDLCEDYLKMSARNKNRSWRTDQSCICLRARKASSLASRHDRLDSIKSLNVASSTVSRLRPFKHSRSFRYIWSRPPSLHPPHGLGPRYHPPFPSICKLLAAFLRSSFVFAKSLQHFWLPTSHLLGTCYLLGDLRSTHTPSKYPRDAYVLPIVIYTCAMYLYFLLTTCVLWQHYMCLTYTVPTIHPNDAYHTYIIPIIHTTHTTRMKHNCHTYHTYNSKHTCHTYHTYLT